MANRATFIDHVETKPLTGPCFHFESASGDEVLHFAMERATAVRVAYDILAAVELASTAGFGEVVPFRRSG